MGPLHRPRSSLDALTTRPHPTRLTRHGTRQTEAHAPRRRTTSHRPRPTPLPLDSSVTRPLEPNPPQTHTCTVAAHTARSCTPVRSPPRVHSNNSRPVGQRNIAHLSYRVPFPCRGHRDREHMSIVVACAPGAVPPMHIIRIALHRIVPSCCTAPPPAVLYHRRTLPRSRLLRPPSASPSDARAPEATGLGTRPPPS